MGVQSGEAKRRHLQKWQRLRCRHHEGLLLRRPILQEVLGRLRQGAGRHVPGEQDMWKRFDEDFRDSACMKNNIMLEPGMELGKELSKEEARSLARQDSKARYEEGWMFPRRWMLPSLNAPLKQLDLFNSKDSELIRTKEDDSKMEVSLDTAQYRPDELKITVD